MKSVSNAHAKGHKKTKSSLQRSINFTHKNACITGILCAYSGIYSAKSAL